ncbi:serine/threonine protein kinase [Bradyrhizobium sp. U87765 SZCCT0131]|uniref:serine/threonine-protein kinase n=1 Tax=unclassified Bradyrhizobium TaxID=2631580 RepID=UPI001BA9AE67|nr:MULTISPECIES: serine/threonine-protein kinase [unclassified Bradyrhizobium]MBR1220430.1 serine/threonine protein kinase [Bradyrhizobium sp. U87765 SZCCT0131]MBR1263115.1 serine/threonine protein kinase [Bradyrhizobium sp. U87765 SZCCT0134]MBR1307002.1 serine/threonine protein kinase [Bradyrhizobium sp. U87765 SZCCT0110]MBR1323110.1 serine/threonine protein kinase [Bradyrhizobium sp. U87765 SZCCT0109]MBR1345956.1 serine/threonine protein kinase [Bradyrhizobium sp. U87765 SZCCT0048]
MTPNEPFRSSYRGVPPGTRLNGIYEIDAMIGAGGMGEVYKCREIQTGAPVAVKMLLPDMVDNEAALGLFRREASALHNLPHDAIVRYFLFTIEPELQRPYLAMEYVDGRSLSDMLEDGPLTFEALVKLMQRVASGLQAAHDRGIIHRDVSPDNIIAPLGDVTRAKIIDFGIARSTQVGDKTIIGTGFAGKDNYVSPEQVGLFGNDVTAKSDVYSLGLVLFHALTGQKLNMGGSQFQLVEKRRRVPDLGAVDMRIRPLLERMLQPDPAARPTMADIAAWRGETAPTTLLRSFDPLARSDSAMARAENMAAAPVPASRRGLWLGGAIAAALLLFGGGYAFYSLVWSSPTVANLPPPPVLGNAKTPGQVETVRPDAGRNDLKKLDVAKAPPTQPEPVKLPAVPPPVTSLPGTADGPGRVDRIRRYVEQYDGGDCFFVMPVALSQSAAVIEGFGAANAPFESFGKAFRREQGFDASMGVRQVTSAQCPAIRFLREVGINPARAPRVSLATTEVKAGETLSGTIENFANRVVELLLVTDRGEVQNMSYLLKPGTDSLSFALPMPRGSGPQLVLAVAAPRVLDSLRQPRATAADTFFLQAASEAQRANLTLSATARYVMLKN